MDAPVTLLMKFVLASTLLTAGGVLSLIWSDWISERRRRSAALARSNARLRAPSTIRAHRRGSGPAASKKAA